MSNDQGALITTYVWVPHGEDADAWQQAIWSALIGPVRDKIGPFTFDFDNVPCPHEQFVDGDVDDDGDPVNVCTNCGMWVKKP